MIIRLIENGFNNSIMINTNYKSSIVMMAQHPEMNIYHHDINFN